MSDGSKAPLGIRFAFDAELSDPAPPASQAARRVETPEAPESPDGHLPRSAIRAVPRTVRPPGEAAASDVDRLMEAAGLIARPALQVTVTTPNGLWVSVQTGHPILIGRSEKDAHLTIADPSISRRHCQVLRSTPHEVVVEDLASANGSWIHRGEKRFPIDAGRPIRLENGDWIGSGPDVFLAHVTIEPHGTGGQPA